MKKHGILIILCTLILACGLLFATREEVSFAPTVANQTTSIVSGYVLKLHNGYIAVFDAERPDIPIRRTDIPASSLRHYDRELLTAGIPLATEEEVFLRLEDFGS